MLTPIVNRAPRAGVGDHLKLTLGAFVLALLVAQVLPTRAELLAAGPHGFVSEHILVLPATPDRTWAALTDETALWWDAEHSYGGKADGFSLQAVAGGCFCEHLADGGSVQHMQVVQVLPGRRLLMHGGLGPLAQMGVAGAMSFAFVPHQNGTELRYRYEVGGFTAGGLEAIAPAVDAVQLGQLRRLKNYLTTGSPLGVEP